MVCLGIRGIEAGFSLVAVAASKVCLACVGPVVQEWGGYAYSRVGLWFDF